MPLFRRQSDDKAKKPNPETSVSESGRFLPPHMKRALQEHSEAVSRESGSSAQYENRRRELIYDIEQGELAASPDNPWLERIELLSEAIAQVEQDLTIANEVPPSPFAAFPTTPLTNLKADKTSISFEIDAESFQWDEVLDWAERGHQVSAPELTQVSGTVEQVNLDSIPSNLKSAARTHLQESLDVLAVDLHDRVLDGTALPSNISLDQLAKPCDICGGWTDWKGRCAACSARKGRLQQLTQERARLIDERAHEAEERHRLAERLPLAKRRLADLEAEHRLR